MIQKSDPQTQQQPGEKLSYSFSIENFEMEIGIAPVESLLLHEETISSSLGRLKKSIRNNGELKDPIIVDKKTLTVLDGMHRATALNELGCKFAPVCFVNYQDPRIKVLTWDRLFKNLDIGDLLELFKKRNFSIESCQLEKQMAEKGGKDVIALAEDKCYVLKKEDKNKIEIYFLIGETEEELKKKGVKIIYEKRENIIKKSETNGTALLLPVPVKKEVIEIASSEYVLPPKTTRHKFPSRPTKIQIPLEWLKTTRSIEEVDSLLTQFLKEKKKEVLPSGSFFEGRKHDEKLCLFK